MEKLLLKDIVKSKDSVKCRKYKWFAAELYPDEDSKHAFAFAWIREKLGNFGVLWIKHDKDVFSEHDIEERIAKNELYKAEGKPLLDIPNVGDLKKPHVHIVFRYPSASRNGLGLSTVEKQFAGVVSHIEGISNVNAYAMYMTHDDLQSHIAGKYHYSEDELHAIGEGEEVIIQNKNCVSIDFWELVDEFNNAGATSWQEGSAICQSNPNYKRLGQKEFVKLDRVLVSNYRIYERLKK